MRSVSGGSRALRAAPVSSRQIDLAARLRSRAKALRAYAERRDTYIETAREAHATLEPHAVGEWLLRQAQAWVPAPCWVVVASDATGRLNRLADVGFVPARGPSLWAAAGWVMRNGVEFFSADMQRDPRTSPGAMGSAIALPLNCRGRTVGALVGLDDEPSKSTPAMAPSLVLALRSLLELSALALDASLALQQAQDLSVTDDLTHLYNSRFLNSVLRRETKRAVRSDRPLSLLFLDLDGFKQVNDRHGHLAGSKVLAEAAEVLKTCARETDVVARFGGDEFALVLPDTSPEGALSAAERIRDTFRTVRFLASEGLAIRQTASIGVATLRPEAPMSAEQLLRAADMAMYRVKAAGKDGVHVAQEGSW